MKLYAIPDRLPALGEKMGETGSVRVGQWPREKAALSPRARLCDEEGEDAEGRSRW